MENASLSYTMAITALVTPMCGTKIDFEAFEKLLDCQIRAGIRDVLVLGSTGEALLLKEDEKQELIARTCQRPQLRVWLGCMETSTQEALDKIIHARRWPVHGLILLAPYYIKPTQNDLLYHFSSLLDASPWPCIVYNNPSRCGVNINESTLIELASHPRFFGIKECDLAPSRIHRLAQRLGSHQWLLCGDDASLSASLMAGARGLVSVASNAVPSLLLRILHHFEKGQLHSLRTETQQWLEITCALESLGNPRGIKALLCLMGYMKADLRAPLIGASNSQLEELRKQLEQRRELLQPLASLNPC